MFIEAFVLRRSVVVAGVSAFCFEEFRDSHENGLVSFRDGGGGAGFSLAGGGGGGGNFTGDILPDRPCIADVESRESRGGSLGSGLLFFAPSPSNDTSSISDVTDIRCAVRSGDLEGAALLLGSSAVALTFFGRLGTSGTGESALLSWAVEDEEPGLLMSDRDDRERSECESGRGVTSEASSKLSPSLSELCELVGLSFCSVAVAVSAMASDAESQMVGQRKSQVKQRRRWVKVHC